MLAAITLTVFTFDLAAFFAGAFFLTAFLTAFFGAFFLTTFVGAFFFFFFGASGFLALLAGFFFFVGIVISFLVGFTVLASYTLVPAVSCFNHLKKIFILRLCFLLLVLSVYCNPNVGFTTRRK